MSKKRRMSAETRKTGSGSNTALVFVVVAVAFILFILIWSSMSKRQTARQRFESGKTQTTQPVPSTGTPMDTGMPTGIGTVPAVTETQKPASPAKPEITYKPCPLCSGTGKCRECGGDGKVVVEVKNPEAGIKWGAIEPPEDMKKPRNVEKECPKCGGSGKCPHCSGSGKVEADKK